MLTQTAPRPTLPTPASGKPLGFRLASTCAALGLAVATTLLPAAASIGRAGSLDTVDAKSSGKDKAPVLQRPERKPRFYLTLGGGAEFDEHATKFISNGEGFLAARPVGIGPGLGVIPVALPVKITSKDFHNTHEFPVIARAEAGYQITDWLSLFGGFTYEHSHGDKAVRFGQVRDPGGFYGPTDAVYNLYADVDDYETYTGRGGFTLAMPRTILDLLRIPKAIKPFLSYSAGGKYVEPSRARFYSPGLLDTGKLRLYDASWVFTTDLQLGYELDFTRNIGVFFQSGYGYDTKLDRSTDGGNSPQSAGLSGTNRGGDRFYSTVSLSAKVRF